MLKFRHVVSCAGVLVLTLITPGMSRAAVRQKFAPAFVLPTLTGTVVSDSLRGKLIYIDFWASWCEPCRRSFPWMRHLQETLGEQGLTTLAINVDKDRAAAAAFLEKYPAPFPAGFAIAFDPAGSTAHAFKVSGMPSSFLIGRDGAILWSHVGFDPKKTTQIETLIRESCTR